MIRSGGTRSQKITRFRNEKKMEQAQALLRSVLLLLLTPIQDIWTMNKILAQNQIPKVLQHTTSLLFLFAFWSGGERRCMIGTRAVEFGSSGS